MKRIAILGAIISLFFSCANSSVETKHNSSLQGKNVFKYAQNIYSRPGSDSVIVYCNWGDSRDSIIYCLHSARETNHASFSQNIATPSQSIATLSTTDIAMLAEIGEINRISGVCDPFRISNEQVRKRVGEGKIANVGSSMEVNLEALVALQPDLVISSAYSKADLQKYQTISKIPVVFTMSWQENSPLARVEWIKFIGMLVGEYQKADSVFCEIERRYLAAKSLAENVAKRPKVLAGAAANDIWYMPGGQSYVAAFIADAGGDFVGKDDNHTGSVVVNFEQVLATTQDVDLWIGCDEKTAADLESNNKNYALLSVFKSRQIYHRGKRCNSDGGNDYWEYGYVRPDLVLQDYIWAIHPELMPEYESVFFERIQ